MWDDEMTDIFEDEAELDLLMTGPADSRLCVFREDENPTFVEWEIWSLGGGEFLTREKEAVIWPRVEKEAATYAVRRVQTFQDEEALELGLQERMATLAEGIVD